MTMNITDVARTIFQPMGATPGNPAVPLLPTVTFKSVAISPPSPPSPWSIDPQRTQELS